MMWPQGVAGLANNVMLPPHIQRDNLPPDYHLLTSPTCLPRDDDEIITPLPANLVATAADESMLSEDVSLQQYDVELSSSSSGDDEAFNDESKFQR